MRVPTGLHTQNSWSETDNGIGIPILGAVVELKPNRNYLSISEKIFRFHKDFSR